MSKYTQLFNNRRKLLNENTHSNSGKWMTCHFLQHRNNFLPILEHYFINVLSESKGIFSHNKFSVYRQAISQISKYIVNNLSLTPVRKDIFLHADVTNNIPEYCKPFVFINEFKNFPLINKLQIFVTSASDYDGQALTSSTEQRIDDECISEFNPSFEIIESNNQLVLNTCSIILCISRKDYITLSNKNVDSRRTSFITNKIQTVISHELIHLLHNVWCVNWIKQFENFDIKKDNINQFLSLHKLSSPVNIDNLFQTDELEITDLAWLIIQCLYYTAKTEQTAQLETIIGECKSNSKFPDTSLKSSDDYFNCLLNISDTFNNIYAILILCEDLLDMLKYKSINDLQIEDINLFWELLQTYYNKTDIKLKDLKQQLKYWIDSLNHFLNKIIKAVKFFNENNNEF